MLGTPIRSRILGGLTRSAKRDHFAGGNSPGSSGRGLFCFSCPLSSCTMVEGGPVGDKMAGSSSPYIRGRLGALVRGGIPGGLTDAISRAAIKGRFADGNSPGSWGRCFFRFSCPLSSCMVVDGSLVGDKTVGSSPPYIRRWELR